MIEFDTRADRGRARGGGRRRTSASNRASARRDQRGAAAVEAALVIPLLALMLFGIIEFSLLLRDHTVVASDVRIGVRMASAGAAAGPGTCEPGTVEDPEPPCTPESAPALAQLAADAIQRSGSAMPEDSINYILVYKANAEGYPGADGNETMPSTCAGVPNCVRFVWRKNANEFRYGGGAWNYKSISACFPGTGADPLDRVGVYLNASHDAVTGLFGDFGLSDHAVMEFEPLPAASCGPDI